MIGLSRTTAQDDVSALSLSDRQRVFQFANLIAAGDAARQIISFDVDVRPQAIAGILKMLDGGGFLRQIEWRWDHV